MSNSNNFSGSTTSDEVVQTFADEVRGRTFLITGASANSIGGENALALARHGSPAQLILPGRSLKTIGPIIDQIKELNKDVKVFYVPLDLSDPSSTRQAAAEILSTPEIDKIDVIINCAGVMGCPYTKTDYKDKEGRPVELQFAINHLGHLLLTNLLLERVRKAAPGARIVNVSSSGHRFGGIRWDDVGFSNGQAYDLWDGYGQSKTANILMAVHLASKIPPNEIASFSVHPGSVPTELQRHLSSQETVQQALARMESIPDFEPRKPKTIPQGAATNLVAALDPALETHSGAYLFNCQISPCAPHAQGEENAERLWKLSEEIIGQEFPL